MPRWNYLGTTGFFATIAAASCITIAATTGLASVRDTPGIAAVPPGTPAYLDAPEARAENRPEVIERPGPSTMSCYRWPNGALTQTFDPNSPACVAEWNAKAGNGGSTAPGVDENIIKVAVPKKSPEIEQLVTWFNANYQMYGRSIALVEIGPMSSAAQQQAGIAAAADAGVFAYADVDASNSGVNSYDALITELAKRNIISSIYGGVQKDEALKSSGPYGWSYGKTTETKFRDLGQLVCNTLAGHETRKNGQATGTPRTFAIAASSGTEFPGFKKDITPMSKELEKCGISAPVYEFQDSGLKGDPALKSRDQAMYKRMKDDGITTVLFAGDSFEFSGSQLGTAHSAGYRPEWVLSRPYMYGGWDYIEGEDADNILGMISTLETIQFTQSPPWRAMMAAGVQQNESWTSVEFERWYYSLGVLAAGIQGAGPNLTAESFAAGLESTDFPSPTAGERPFNPPTTGFQLGTHQFVQDSVIGRFDVTKKSGPLPYGWCIGFKGQRFGFENPWPKTDDEIYDPQFCQ